MTTASSWLCGQLDTAGSLALAGTGARIRRLADEHARRRGAFRTRLASRGEVEEEQVTKN